MRLYRESTITAIKTTQYRAGHADATTALRDQHKAETDGLRRAFDHITDQLNDVIDKSRARNQRLCTEKEALTEALTQAETHAANLRTQLDAASDADSGDCKDCDTARNRIRQLEETVRALGAKLAELTAANHAEDIPLLALEENGEVTA